MQTPLTFFFAFVAVLVLIGLVAWLVRRFAGNRLGGSAGRGRMPRLAVIDAAAVDGRRRLVLVRRDNVEHLLMIGGPSDIVVEPNIVRAGPARDQVSPRGEASGRLNPYPDEETASPAEPVEPSLPERPARPSFADELRRPAAPPPPPPIPERRHDPLATISSDPVTRPEPRPDLRAPRNEPVMPRPPLRPVESPTAVKAPPLRAPEPPAPTPALAPTPPPPPQDLATADQNLAEMAKRLEAALRRPSGDARPAASEPQAAPPATPAEAPAVRPAPRVSIEPASGGSATPAPEVAPPTRPKGDFENLEDEMASLLGRPKTPS